MGEKREGTEGDASRDDKEKRKKIFVERLS